MHKRIILASQSPRRKQLLEQAEIVFDVVLFPTDESYPPDLPVEQVPLYIAEQKAIAASAYNFDAIVIAADTVVVLGNEIIGKPEDAAAAIAILQKLSGQEHRVITGVCIHHEGKAVSFSATTHVLFNELRLSQIEHYVHHYAPYDKAGAYAIQEWIGAIGIAAIHGDYYNVMGLPVHQVVAVLESMHLP
jgi:septum formation protein